jgi:hypothetical protein
LGAGWRDEAKEGEGGELKNGLGRRKKQEREKDNR